MSTMHTSRLNRRLGSVRKIGVTEEVTQPSEAPKGRQLVQDGVRQEFGQGRQRIRKPAGVVRIAARGIRPTSARGSVGGASFSLLGLQIRLLQLHTDRFTFSYQEIHRDKGSGNTHSVAVVIYTAMVARSSSADASC